MQQQWAALRVHAPPIAAGRVKNAAPPRAQAAPAPSPPPPDPSLSARERRKLRNDRREALAGVGGWREAVEERLLHRPKKSDRPSWKAELNLDNLSLLGPQWWVVRVSRAAGHDTVDRLARRLADGFPSASFKVYYPAVKEKRRLKSGAVSVKPRPVFPGCVFLHCVMNKDVHDFVREVEGVGGFLGSRVGNSKRQINKPKPVGAEDMEDIFIQTKREQELHDISFEEEEEKKVEQEGLRVEERRKGKTKKVSQVSEDVDSLFPGKNVRIVSGSFANYVGLLKKIDIESRMATVGITMFGKETIVDVDCEEIVAEAR